MRGRARRIKFTAKLGPSTTATYTIYDCGAIRTRGRGRSLRVALAVVLIHTKVSFRVPEKPGRGGPPRPGPYPRGDA